MSAALEYRGFTIRMEVRNWLPEPFIITAILPSPRLSYEWRDWKEKNNFELPSSKESFVKPREEAKALIDQFLEESQ